jgi:hypothetical protein
MQSTPFSYQSRRTIRTNHPTTISDSKEKLGNN